MDYWELRPILEKLPPYSEFNECRASLEEFVETVTRNNKHLTFRVIKHCNDTAKLYCVNYSWSCKYGNRLWFSPWFIYIQLPVSWIPKCLCCKQYPLGGIPNLIQPIYKSKELTDYSCLNEQDYICINCHKELLKLDSEFLLLKESKTLINKLKQVSK